MNLIREGPDGRGKVAQVTNEGGMKQKSGLPTDLLHIFVLFSFALAQPLFDLLSRNAEFFVARRSQPIDVIFLILILCLLLPALVVLVEMVAGLLGQRVRRGVHGLIVAGLVAGIVLPVLKQIDGVSGTVLMVGAVLFGMATAIGYARFHPIRLFLTVLSPAVFLFPSLFLLNSSISKVVFTAKDSSAVYTKVNATAPVVMVVFDEFSLVSLMDRNRQIDPFRYPHFAALAQEATWFRNATTVADFTTAAVPAILTGNYPDRFRLPTAADHPHNLFTLLGGTYELKVFESRTQLCPEQLCGSSAEDKNPVRRMNSLLRDLFVVYLHLLLPMDWSAGLPSITQDWMNFAADAAEVKQGSKDEDLLEQWLAKLVQVRPLSHPQDRFQQFEQFLNTIHFSQKPTLYFLHILLPHIPYIYLPSGNIYSTNSGLEGLISAKWSDNERAVIEAYQRYLLQVGFMDTLIGRLMTRLKAASLYEPSLIVVTADHGVSFQPNDGRRTVTKTNSYDIMAVPLFIKMPYQRTGMISDRNMETIDILPTMTHILGIHLPAPIDGHSALSLSLPERVEKVIFSGQTSQRRLVFAASSPVGSTALERQLALFGSGTKLGKVLKNGSYRELLGQHVNEIGMAGEVSLRVELDQATFFADVDLEASFIPAHISGRVFLDINPAVPLNLAIGVNGTIRAVTRTFEGNGDVAKFSALVPETAFRAGKNNVEIFIVSNQADKQTKLVRAKPRSAGNYSLVVAAGREAIRSSEGLSIPVVSGTLLGFLGGAVVKDGFVQFHGWAADVKNSQLVEAIWVFVDGEFFYSGKTNVARPDVVKAYKNTALHGAGFDYTFPVGSFKDMTDAEIRLFAVSKNGVASELNYPQGYQWGKKSRGMLSWLSAYLF